MINLNTTGALITKLTLSSYIAICFKISKIYSTNQQVESSVLP